LNPELVLRIRGIFFVAEEDGVFRLLEEKEGFFHEPADKPGDEIGEPESFSKGVMDGGFDFIVEQEFADDAADVEEFAGEGDDLGATDVLEGGAAFQDVGDFHAGIAFLDFGIEAAVDLFFDPLGDG